MSGRPWNTFVEGDNLDVLATLAAEGAEFDLVYIDPPYNTGNDFAYHDDRRGADGRRGGRHAAWVEMMRPRLEGARVVMGPGAAICVSIDDNEAAYLRLLLDEVFGERNFLAQVVVNLNAKGRQLGHGFATSHEYLMVFAREARTCLLDATSPDHVVEDDFPLTAPDGRRYRHLPLRNTNKKFNPVTAPTLHFPVWGDPESGEVRTQPFDGAVEIAPVFGDGAPAVWRWSRPRIEDRPGDLVCRRIKGRLGERVDVFQRDWLHPLEGQRRKKLRTIWPAEEIGSTDTAVAELKALVGHVFESPKPTGLLRRIIGTMPPDARVLDFFAGSGTTGHAVALANLADGGTRTCLSVNVAEPTRPGSNAHRAGLTTVADITRARLRAVADQLGGGLVERVHGATPGGARGERRHKTPEGSLSQTTA
jgi:adenine-specific DNA-methyltransferase